MMRIRHAFGYALAAVMLGAAITPIPAPAQQASTNASRANAVAGPGNAENGRKAFIAHSCYSCHGYWAEGGVGARLVGYADTLQAFATYVRQPKGVMPPAGAKVTTQEITDIYTWVRSVPPSPDPKTIDLLKP